MPKNKTNPVSGRQQEHHIAEGVASEHNQELEAMPARLFIASVGNPGSLHNTLHSAGHHLVDAIRACLQYPAFISNYGLSVGPTHALYKSPGFMNVSGKYITKAYKSFVSSLPADERSRARLVVVHDELELPLGQMKVRTSGSLKGHNGLKSIQASLGGQDFTRLGVGIGRPESRSTGAVSDYVLRQMTPFEKSKIESQGDQALQHLGRIEGET